MWQKTQRRRCQQSGGRRRDEKLPSPCFRLYRVNIFHLVKCAPPFSLQLFPIYHAACSRPERQSRPVGLRCEEPFIRHQECRLSSINTGAANKSGHFQGRERKGEKKNAVQTSHTGHWWWKHTQQIRTERERVWTQLGARRQKRLMNCTHF